MIFSIFAIGMALQSLASPSSIPHSLSIVPCAHAQEEHRTAHGAVTQAREQTAGKLQQTQQQLHQTQNRLQHNDAALRQNQTVARELTQQSQKNQQTLQQVQAARQQVAQQLQALKAQQQQLQIQQQQIQAEIASLQIEAAQSPAAQAELGFQRALLQEKNVQLAQNTQQLSLQEVRATDLDCAIEDLKTNSQALSKRYGATQSKGKALGEAKDLLSKAASLTSREEKRNTADLNELDRTKDQLATDVTKLTSGQNTPYLNPNLALPTGNENEHAAQNTAATTANEGSITGSKATAEFSDRSGENTQKNYNSTYGETGGDSMSGNALLPTSTNPSAQARSNSGATGNSNTDRAGGKNTGTQALAKTEDEKNTNTTGAAGGANQNRRRSSSGGSDFAMPDIEGFLKGLLPGGPTGTTNARQPATADAKSKSHAVPSDTVHTDMAPDIGASQGNLFARVSRRYQLRWNATVAPEPRRRSSGFNTLNKFKNMKIQKLSKN